MSRGIPGGGPKRFGSHSNPTSFSFDPERKRVDAQRSLDMMKNYTGKGVMNVIESNNHPYSFPIGSFENALIGLIGNKCVAIDRIVLVFLAKSCRITGTTLND
jgi:hypothetical protein